jgi:hypothetical protein
MTKIVNKMEKESVYFPHFVSARNDRKLKRVRRELGVEGYGIYFMLLEVLREQSDLKYPMNDIDLLADEFGTSEQKVRVVICNYGLFEMQEDGFFYSPNQILYLRPFFEKSKRAKHAAILRWHGESDANAYANALPEHSKSNANAMQGKERIVRKEKESIDPSLFFHELSEQDKRDTLNVTAKEIGVTPEQVDTFYMKMASKDFARTDGNPYTVSAMQSEMMRYTKNGWLKVGQKDNTKTEYKDFSDVL